MSSHCATLLYRFCPLTAVSDCLMLPSPPSFLLGMVCAAPRCLGIVVARGKVHFSSVESWLLELNPSPKQFSHPCALFPCQGGENTLIAQAEEWAALLCHRVVSDGYIIEIIPFAPILYQTWLLRRTRHFRSCSPWLLVLLSELHHLVFSVA